VLRRTASSHLRLFIRRVRSPLQIQQLPRSFRAASAEANLSNGDQLFHFSHMLATFENLKFIELLKQLDGLTARTKQSQFSSSKFRLLPSREIFEHFLARVYGAYRMFKFMLSLIREKIFFFLVKSIQMAVFMPNNLIFLGTVSRIYCLLKKVII